MSKVGTTRAYRYFADRYYLDRANRDTYLARNAAADILLSGNLVLPALSTLDGVDLSVHAADLDAHISSPYELIRTGVYYAGPYVAGDTSSKALVAATLYTMIFHVSRNITIDRIGVYVSTGVAAKFARLGIYNNGTNLYPGTLLLDAGFISVADTGIIVATISQALTKGIYHLAIVSNGAPSIYGVVTVIGSPLGLRTSWPSTQGVSEWSVAQAYGALPDPFTAGGALTALGGVLLFVRPASLD